MKAIGDDLTTKDRQEAPYQGLLGLDGIHPAFKGLNFLVTVSVGILLAFPSWYEESYRNSILYEFSLFSWPLLFLFAWPACAIPLWLRLTGVRWRWGFLGLALVLIIYLLISAVLSMIVV